MVTYNPKDWFTLIIQFHKSDTFRRLFWSLVSIGLYSAAIVYSEAHFFHLETKNPTVMHSILGFVLSMLLVFRTNSAYDRWWEGRKVWGSTVNNSRNLALKLSAILVHEKDKQEIKHLITNYVFAFKNHLRNKYIQEEFLEANKDIESFYEYRTEKFDRINLLENTKFAKKSSDGVSSVFKVLERK